MITLATADHRVECKDGLDLFGSYGSEDKRWWQ